MSDSVTLKRKAQQCLVELEKVSTPYERTFTYIESTLMYPSVDALGTESLTKMSVRSWRLPSLPKRIAT